MTGRPEADQLGRRRLETLIAEVLGASEDDITDATGPRTTGGWTSLRHVQVIAAVIREYGVRLTAREARSCRTVGDLRRLLAEKGYPA